MELKSLLGEVIFNMAFNENNTINFQKSKFGLAKILYF